MGNGWIVTAAWIIEGNDQIERGSEEEGWRDWNGMPNAFQPMHGEYHCPLTPPHTMSFPCPPR